MLTQRTAIVAAMKERGWHLAEVDDDPSEWWADERLVFESRWTPVGAKVFLTFMVDPQCDGPRAKGQQSGPSTDDVSARRSRALRVRAGLLHGPTRRS